MKGLASCQNYWQRCGMNPTQIVQALGGATKMSRDIGASRSAISNWPRYGIPARYWPAVARLAATRDETKHITLDTIEAAHARDRAPVEAA